MSSLPLKAASSTKASEPSMEEILASIRKIISDEDAKPAAKAPAPVSEPASAGEPEPAAAQSQDDIDALLADFDAAPVPAPAPKAPEPEPPQPAEPDVLELTEEMAADDFATDIDFVDAPMPQPAPEPAPVSFNGRGGGPAKDMPPQPAVPQPEERLLSSSSDAAISAAFGKLTHTILSQNARTLDDLVQDMLRPMLKSWLDDNLPTVVERLVRAEIDRVSRGGR